ncbi:MAG: hypothetical protein JSS82_15490 [Bacteroidetes bacterium]|nr:hypothetical protein [Bacteroidota bacterium]
MMKNKDREKQWFEVTVCIEGEGNARILKERILSRFSEPYLCDVAGGSVDYGCYSFRSMPETVNVTHLIAPPK